ncbi:hypothetical protein ACIP9C_22760 [Lysinibacillus sp. NPDC093210]|uniref:hypothetical protein n=1 Tax=Lysinibacillus sp. NPDC093210 TaxID=3364133 RepID=UPI003823CDD6
MIGYAYPNGDGSYALFFNINGVPEWMRPIVEEMTIPEGSGILQKKEDGSFYYEPFPIDHVPTPEPEPEPVPPVETIEEKINNLFNMTEQNNLITVDAVLGVYEEVLALREEVAALKEITNNV